MLPGWRERSLVITELMREPLDIALPEGHPLAAQAELTPADVIGEKWIGVPVGPPFDRILQRVEAITGQQADVVQRFIDNGIVESMVAGGPRHRDPAALHDARPRERPGHAAARGRALGAA